MTIAVYNHFLRKVLAVAIVVAGLSAVPSGVARAQDNLTLSPTVQGDQGLRASGTYEGVQDNVNLINGNLQFCIPLVSLRGPQVLPGLPKFDLNIPLCYNSEFAPLGSTPGVNQGAALLPWFPWNAPYAMGYGWTLTGVPAQAMVGTIGDVQGSVPEAFMPDGSVYDFASASAPSGQQTPPWGTDYQQADLFLSGWGTGLNGALYLKNGIRIEPTSPNGNVNYFQNSLTETDTVNHFIVFNFPSNTITDAVGRTVTVSSTHSSISFQYPDPTAAGQTQTVTVELTTINIPPGANCPWEDSYQSTNGEPLTGEVFPSAVILPNGKQYTLQYNSCAQLVQINYPNGGYTRYDYGNGVLGGWTGPYFSSYIASEIYGKHVCPVPASVTTLPAQPVCPVAEQTTTYFPATDGVINAQNTVIDPAGNKTVYTFSDPNPLPYDKVQAVEVERQLYDSSNKLWETVTTHYVNTLNPAPPTNPTACQNLSALQTFDGAADLPTLPSDQETILDNNETAEIQWTYNCQSLGYGPTELMDKKEYDYGSGGAHGALLKETKYDWLELDSNGAYYLPPGLPPNVTSGIGANILDRKTGETVYDGNGKKVEQTTWQYDNNAPSGGLFGAHGVLTQVSHWSNTNGMLTTTYTPTYGSGGAFTGYTATYPNGTQVTYNFTDNYVGGISPISPSNPIFTNGNTQSSGNPYNAYPTTITTTANGKSYVEQRQYYWGSGLVAASCGYNYSGACAGGQSDVPDNVAYTYDLFGRQTSATTGDGGSTTTCYSDDPGSSCASAPPFKTVSTEMVSSGINKVSTSFATYEGSTGLPTTTTQLNSDPSCSGGTINVDTTYDLDGRKSTVSNPYCSNNPSASTSGTTTYSYDGLSRVTQVLNPDGTYSTSTYTGRAVLSADEGSGNNSGSNRIQRISQTDALGRLTAVCEIWSGGTSLEGAITTPSSCGLDVSGTGFLTTYGYDASNSNGPLEAVTSVTQGNESRSFTYDSMGNLRSATNPESGTTNYTVYGNEDNLISKTDARGITTTYSYDGLNRLTAKSYSDGTPSACFQYDQTTFQNGVGYDGNGIGRLTAEWTLPGRCQSSTIQAGVTWRSFLYDFSGRTGADQQGGNAYHLNAEMNYEYTTGGDLEFLGLSVGNSYLDYNFYVNSADRLSTITGSMSASQNSPIFNLFTANSYSPAGAITSAQIGPGVTLSRTYNSRLLPTGETDTIGPTPGTATVQVIGNEESYTQGAETLTISGSEQSSGGSYEYGYLVVSINGGEPLMVRYGGAGTTPQSIAVAFASQWPGSCTGGTPTTATASGAVITITDCLSAGITVSAYFTTNFPTPGFSTTTGSSSGSTVYDSGSATLIVNGTQVARAHYGQNSTAASIASGLVSGVSSLSPATLSADSYGDLTVTALDTGATTDYSYALNIVSSNPTDFPRPSFSGASGTLEGGTTVPLYSWTINSYAPNCATCYAPNGDVLGMTDSVMGTWQYGNPSGGVRGYDDMNRLVQATATSGPDQGMTLNWAYDIYGNRWSQTATGTGGGTATQPQLSFSGNNNRINGYTYDADGNLLNDGLNTYTYDAENRIASVNGEISYAYDAGGNRVQKFSGGNLTATYVLTLDNRQLMELNSSGALVHSNLYAPGGRLLATYDSSLGSVPGYTYNITDWLGTKRMQTTGNGSVEERCLSNPFGDGLSCTGGADSTEQHFTGKDRDVESSLDYFGARYYASSMGRFMSPDWTAQADPVPWAELENPQTLNLYAYVQNNPLSRTDPFGHATDPCAGIPNCVSVTADPPPVIELTAIFIGDGHHFIPQKLFQGASDLAKNFFKNWKTGPLPNPGDHQGYSGPHRNFTEAIRKIIAQVEEETGKPISQWGKAEIEKAVEEVREAGGDVKSFLNHIEENNPAAKTVRNAVGWIEEKAGQVQNNPAVQQIEQEGEELIQECESGGCPP